jgi:transposase
MGRPKKERAPLPPIWRTPDELWTVVEAILVELDPPKQGPKRIDQRAALDAIIFRVRSGCQWNRLPAEYPDDSSVHRTLQRWIGLGVFERIWAVAQEACEDLGGATGSGRQPMAPCGRRVWGGPCGSQPH